jgi:hypothetical protein
VEILRVSNLSLVALVFLHPQSRSHDVRIVHVGSDLGLESAGIVLYVPPAIRTENSPLLEGRITTCTHNLHRVLRYQLEYSRQKGVANYFRIAAGVLAYVCLMSAVLLPGGASRVP